MDMLSSFGGGKHKFCLLSLSSIMVAVAQTLTSNAHDCIE